MAHGEVGTRGKNMHVEPPPNVTPVAFHPQQVQNSYRPRDGSPLGWGWGGATVLGAKNSKINKGRHASKGMEWNSWNGMEWNAVQ